MRSDVTYCAVRRPPAPPSIPARRSAPSRWTAPVGGASWGGRGLQASRPAAAGCCHVTVRCQRAGPRSAATETAFACPFPLARASGGAGPRSVTRETASLAPVLALPLAAAAPVPAGGALPMAAALEAALGTACCWGLSPALDLHQHRELRLPARFPPPPPPRSIFPGNTDFFFPGNPGFSPVPHAGNGDATALLVGAAEGRHLLLTASRAHREPRCAITVRLPDGGGRLPALHGRSPR